MTSRVDRAEASEPTPLSLVLEELEHRGIPYWIIDGCEGQGQAATPDDVDCVMPRQLLPQLPPLLKDVGRAVGGTLVGWQAPFPLKSLPHALLAFLHDGEIKTVNLHVRPDFNRAGRFFYRGEELVGASRRSTRPAPPRAPVAFGAQLLEKILNGSFTASHGRVLTALYRRDPIGCRAEIARLWRTPPSIGLLASAAETGEWDDVLRARTRLRREARRLAARRRPVWTARYFLLKAVRFFWRRLRPARGLHVALLGPDGVGKSTVIEGIQAHFAPLFPRVRVQTPAPALLRRQGLRTGNPHGKQPHSGLGSVAQAVYWLVYYGIAYFWRTYPALRRGGLVLDHRYVLDALVDPRRYRYAGPPSLLRLVWRLVPKPDVVIVLDAPAPVVAARKRELPLAALEELRGKYRAIPSWCSGARLVDASQSIAWVQAAVDTVLLEHLEARIPQAAPGPAWQPS